MALQAASLPIDTRDKERNPRQMMASCLSKLHSDPTFSIALFSPLGPHSGSGAVPRTPATPPHPECPQRRRAAMRILPQRRKAHPTPKGQHATPKSPHESNMQRQKAHATPKSQERLFGNGCEHPTPKGFKGETNAPSFFGRFFHNFFLTWRNTK